MIKTKQPVLKMKNAPLSRKPSLPIRRTSSAQSNISAQSCLSDRLVYHKFSHDLQSQSKHHDYTEIKNEKKKRPTDKVIEKAIDKAVQKAVGSNLPKKESTQKDLHSLTSFQWLLIMRHLLHLENKKRSVVHIKQRTLLNCIKNKMYPDSIWSKVLVVANESKFTSEDVVHAIEKSNKSKLSFDDLFTCLSNLYERTTTDNEDPVQTARFMEQMKSMEDVDSKHRKAGKQRHISIEVGEEKQMSSKIEAISPVSVSNNHTQNQISFSMEYDSQQSRFSQITQQTKFDAAFTALQKYKAKIQQHQLLELRPFSKFIEQLLNYTVYMYKGENSDYIYGLKLLSSEAFQSVGSKNLLMLFNAQEINEYVGLIHGVKFNNIPKQISLLTPMLTQNIKLMNISHNNLRGVSFLKERGKFINLEFLNINSNRVNNVSDLMSLPNLTELHAKNNVIDHISISAKENTNRLRLLDLGWNQISKEEDLWSLRNLSQLKMINLAGNGIMRGQKWMGLIRKQLILNYEDLYIFSSYSEYKDIAFDAPSLSLS